MENVIGAAGGTAQIGGILARSSALVKGGIIGAGVGIAVTSGVSGARAYQQGDVPGAVACAVGALAGGAVAGVVFGAPLLLLAGTVAALGVGAFHLYRWANQ